jgi:hypothetical protein
LQECQERYQVLLDFVEKQQVPTLDYSDSSPEQYLFSPETTLDASHTSDISNLGLDVDVNMGVGLDMLDAIGSDLSPGMESPQQLAADDLLLPLPNLGPLIPTDLAGTAKNGGSAVKKERSKKSGNGNGSHSSSTKSRRSKSDKKRDRKRKKSKKKASSSSSGSLASKSTSKDKESPGKEKSKPKGKKTSGSHVTHQHKSAAASFQSQLQAVNTQLLYPMIVPRPPLPNLSPITQSLFSSSSASTFASSTSVNSALRPLLSSSQQILCNVPLVVPMTTPVISSIPAVTPTAPMSASTLPLQQQSSLPSLPLRATAIANLGTRLQLDKSSISSAATVATPTMPTTAQLAPSAPATHTPASTVTSATSSDQLVPTTPMTISALASNLVSSAPAAASASTLPGSTAPSLDAALAPPVGGRPVGTLTSPAPRTFLAKPAPVTVPARPSLSMSSSSKRKSKSKSATSGSNGADGGKDGGDDGTPAKRRRRRTAAEIERKFKCEMPNCTKAYGSEGALKMHIKLKHPGVKQPALKPPGRLGGPIPLLLNLGQFLPPFGLSQVILPPQGQLFTQQGLHTSPLLPSPISTGTGLLYSPLIPHATSFLPTLPAVQLSEAEANGSQEQGLTEPKAGADSEEVSQAPRPNSVTETDASIASTEEGSLHAMPDQAESTTSSTVDVNTMDAHQVIEVAQTAASTDPTSSVAGTSIAATEGNISETAQQMTDAEVSMAEANVNSFLRLEDLADNFTMLAAGETGLVGSEDLSFHADTFNTFNLNPDTEPSPLRDELVS